MRLLYFAQLRFPSLLVITIFLASIHHPGYASLPSCSLGEKHIDWNMAPQNHIAYFEQLSLANTHGRIQGRSRLPMVYHHGWRAGSDAYPWAQTPTIRVITLDESNRAAAAVRLELRRAGAVVGGAVTNEKGEAEFPLPAPGDYEITAAKEEFETLTQSDLRIVAGTAIEVRFVMVPKIKIGEKIDVTASAASAAPLEQGASPPIDLQRQQVKDSAVRVATVADALPLVPGVIRTDQGYLKISGTSENRSAMLVNSADVTDPATGQFGMTVPVDVVNTISVFKTPYLAQYGRFTAGVSRSKPGVAGTNGISNSTTRSRRCAT